MSPVLLTLAAIVFIFTSIAIWAYRESNDGWMAFSIVAAAFTLIFGFGMFGTLNTMRSEEAPCKVYEVLKGKHIVVVSTNRGNVIFDNYKIEDINDSTKFFWTLDYNHYNVEINKTLIYK